ncbi:MAG TPA: glycosyl hydrolase family protein [Armatimonadetes bacterium]|nr:glycosyl hydrolase family protein [Armatimonadota bacterium]
MHLTVPLFLPGGEWQLEFGIYKVRLDDDGVVSQRVTVVPRKAKPSYCAVRMHNGAPTLFINGKPVFGMLFWGFRIDDYKRCNVHIYTVGVPLCWYKDKVDFTEADRAILQILSRDPQGFIIPRVYIGAPRWWCNAHEGELTRYADGVGWVGGRWGGTRHQSFASTLWLKEASQALRRFIAHMQRSPFADRIIGYHIANGIYGEWHYWSPIHLPDTSEPMRRAFITWCKRKYGTIERLNATWGTKLRNFDEIRIPDMNARLSADIGIFRDPKRSRWVIDYYQCFHETTANAIAHFCRVVKDATDGRAIVGAFYAYLPDLGWAMEGDHLAPAILFNEPAIDFFASPHSYARRALGQDGNFRAYPESIRLHGKLFFDEGDDRTHLAHGDPVHMHAKTRHESLQILWREFANVLTHHCAFWWMDQQLCWFHDEILQAAIRKMKRIGDESLKQQRKRVSQVAVLCSTSSFFYLINQRSRKERIMQPLVNHQIEQLYRMGAPFDVYIVEDLPRIPDRYRCYVLLNCFHLPRKLRDELKRRVRRDGRMLISFYAPGLIDDEVLDERNMFETTGIQLRLRDEPCAMRVILRDSPITRDIPKVTRIEFSDLEKPVRRREFDNIKNWLIGRRDEVLREYFETFTVEQVNDAKMGRAIRWCIKHIKSGQPSDVHVRLRFEKPIARIGVWVKNVSRKSVWFWVKFYEADRSEYRVAPKRLATDDEWHYYEFDVSEYMLAPWSHDENDKLDFPIVQITMVVPGTKLNEPYEFWFAGLTVTPARKVMVRHTASYAAWGNNPQFIAPTIFADDPKCQVLGTFVGCGLPAFVIKRFGEWTSVYSASPGVPWQILRELMRLAGVHVYVESGDNLYVDNRFIALHTVSGGVKRINLLKHATVRDLIHDRTIAVDASKFEIELPKFTTALFELL